MDDSLPMAPPPQPRLKPPPPPLRRPALAHFLWERGLYFRDATAAHGGPLPRSHEYVRQLCRPFDDPRRVTPSEAEKVALYTWSGGLIGLGAFDLPAARPAQPALDRAVAEAREARP